ncbi:MAG: hypothetical protein EOM40_17165 [Clostridia bacterium]|nr:hypothetical protein [Clostridia bacterium]NCC44407.1 hypothetical protein [Clostridia bacterium]
MSNTVLALALASIGIILVAFLIYYLLVAIAQWKVYSKAGEAGWKSLIPIYRYHVLYKISWKPMFFWIMFLLEIVVAGLRAYIYQSVAPGAILNLILFVLSLIVLIIHIMQCVKMSHAYGHGGGFAVGLIFLQPIFLLILGFGSSQYQGPQD